jgi:hypothetical protein
MTTNSNIRAKLEILRKDGALPKSACSGALLKHLRPLLDAGVIIEERAGAGRRLVVRGPQELHAHVRSAFPDVPVTADAPSRVASIARFRDSKALAGDTPDILTLRAWSDTALWRDGHRVLGAEGTAAHGVFSFVLKCDAHYELRGPWALVEGPVMLLHFEHVPLQHDLPAVLYGGGRISRRTLGWLASQAAPDFRLVHFPDYDPVGLNEFIRVRTALGARAMLHLPENLGCSFEHFSKRALLHRRASQKLLPRVRSSAIAEVKTVLKLIDDHNAGLEQEQLLLGATFTS